MVAHILYDRSLIKGDIEAAADDSIHMDMAADIAKALYGKEMESQWLPA